MKGFVAFLALVLCLATFSQSVVAVTDMSLVSSVWFDANKRYLPGEELVVTLKGVSGGTATFDIGDLAKAIPMAEIEPGIYLGSYRLPKDPLISNVQVVGHIQLGDRTGWMNAPYALSTSIVKRIVTNLLPDNGSSVILEPAAITFKHDKVNFFLSLYNSHVYFDGMDITAFCTITQDTVLFRPTSPISLGKHLLTFLTRDASGQPFQFWLTFTVEAPVSMQQSQVQEQPQQQQ